MADRREQPSADPVSMLLEDQLCFALYSATQAIQARYRSGLRSLGLTYPQYLVLLVLWEGDGLAVSEIGERLGLDSATLTPLLKRMEQSGLISRSRSASDERRVEVTLTPDGAALQARVQDVTAEVTCAAFDALPGAAALRDDLAKLRDELQND